ncbi:hypothetical protein [Acetobacter oeni]|uniref:hypothetical protein n=1 Tax=Acetobacter oeni TaxID=304077 RepID=UPI0011BDC9F7|nr:hypothetical protein [Acetobacter oeni]MBB3883320.1 hypothetical protein [Acetobacter oeni]NHO19512.1 hypothetical protein [Acetobacter oeni]
MIGKVLRKLTLFTAGVSVAVIFFGEKPAYAERVISDYEASKLTLESLTATPVYHVPRHVSVASHSGSRIAWQPAARRNSHGLVHLASFHVARRTVSAAHVRHRT